MDLPAEGLSTAHSVAVDRIVGVVIAVTWLKINAFYPRVRSPGRPWHFLYFFPEPQGHGSFAPIFCPGRFRLTVFSWEAGIDGGTGFGLSGRLGGCGIIRVV
jgi:hypothetical protein